MRFDEYRVSFMHYYEKVLEICYITMYIQVTLLYYTLKKFKRIDFML